MQKARPREYRGRALTGNGGTSLADETPDKSPDDGCTEDGGSNTKHGRQVVGDKTGQITEHARDCSSYPFHLFHLPQLFLEDRVNDTRQRANY